MFSREEVVKFYVLKTAVCEMVADQVRKFPYAERSNLSAVCKVAVAVGIYQHSLLSDVEEEEKYREKSRTARTISKVVMVMPSVPEMAECPKWEMMAPSAVFEK